MRFAAAHRLRQQAIAAGAQPVDVRQRHGELAETRQEQQAGVQLFVLGRRSASAGATQRDLGRNVEGAVRAVERPILAMTEAFVPPSRVLFAFDGSGVTRRGVEMIAGSPCCGTCRLLVMGSYSYSPLRSMLLGGRTTDLLRASTVPCLPLR